MNLFRATLSDLFLVTTELVVSPFLDDVPILYTSNSPLNSLK